EQSVAAATRQNVIPGTAVQSIGAVVADQNVIVRAAGDVFDLLELVAVRIATIAESGREIDENSDRGTPVARGVESVATHEAVGAAAADQAVIAGAADHHVA